MKQKSNILAINPLGEKLFAVEKRSFNNYKASIHWHDCIEIEIVLSGTGKNFTDNKTFTFSRGDCWLYSYLGSHSAEFDTKIEIINIVFREDLLPQSIKTTLLTTPYILCKFTEDELAFIELLYEKLVNEEKNSRFSKEYCSSLLSTLVVMILRKSSQIHYDLPFFIQQAIVEIHKNFKNDISLNTVAKKIGVSTNYLGKIITATLNMNFNKYLNSLRLRHACNLLKHTKMSIKEIAFNSGYNSFEYFLSVFKNAMNISPSVYRKNNTD